MIQTGCIRLYLNPSDESEQICQTHSPARHPKHVCSDVFACAAFRSQSPESHNQLLGGSSQDSQVVRITPIDKS